MGDLEAMAASDVVGGWWWLQEEGTGGVEGRLKG